MKHSKVHQLAVILDKYNLFWKIMKKKIILIIVLFLSVVAIGAIINLSHKQDITQIIDENLSLDNRNIKAYYKRTDGVYSDIDIINESFSDYDKYDSNLLYDEETYYSNINKFVEWMHPQYQELLNEIVNSKYLKIDYINGTEGLVVILKNLDTQFTVYIYEDNKIKIVDDKINESYQSTANFSKCYEVFDNYDEKLLNFILKK